MPSDLSLMLVENIDIVGRRLELRTLNMPPEDAPPPNDGRPTIAIPHSSAVTLADAYDAAFEEMERAAPRAPGVRLFWTHGGQRAWLDLALGGAHAILGRHQECDAVLSADANTPLRRLLATTMELSDGVAFRLLDLQTGRHFFLADDVPRQSLVAYGPTAVRVGQYIVGAIPIDDEDGALRLRAGALPRPIVTDAKDMSAEEPDSSPAPSSDRSRITHITSLPMARPIFDLPKCEPPVARLTLERGELRSTLDVSAADLDLGILVGRAVAGCDEALAAVLDENISRGHVLLLRDGEHLDAFDLCSTQGTFVSGKRVRRHRFEAADERMMLGVLAPVGMRLEWL